MRESMRLQRLATRLQQGGIRDTAVLKAMARIPRTAFVDEALHGKAYSDTALPIGERQTISQPWIVARMCELLEPDGTGRVLEVGTGSGYHAAVLSGLFERVFTVERLLNLSRKAQRRLRDLQLENVHFKVFDGSYGWGEFAPYRAILVTAAAPEVPSPLLEQLEPEGRLVVPLSRVGKPLGGDQILMRYRRRDGRWAGEEHGTCSFVPLMGRYGWPHE